MLSFKNHDEGYVIGTQQQRGVIGEQKGLAAAGGCLHIGVERSSQEVLESLPLR